MSLMRRFYRYFFTLALVCLVVEIFGQVLLDRELVYLSETTKSTNENYRELSRLTKGLLKGQETKGGLLTGAIDKKEWLKAWQTYDKGISELGTKEFQFLLSEKIKTRKDNILLFWYSSRINFEKAVKGIDEAVPENPKDASEIGVFNLLDKAKREGDRRSIILLSELVSNLVSFDVFAKEIMQEEMLLLNREVDEHIERIKYYYWLQVSVVFFVFFVLSIVLIFTRDPAHPSVKKRRRKPRDRPIPKRAPPRYLNEKNKLG